MRVPASRSTDLERSARWAVTVHAPRKSFAFIARPNQRSRSGKQRRSSSARTSPNLVHLLPLTLERLLGRRAQLEAAHARLPAGARPLRLRGRPGGGPFLHRPVAPAAVGDEPPPLRVDRHVAAAVVRHRAVPRPRAEHVAVGLARRLLGVGPTSFDVDPAVDERFGGIASTAVGAAPSNVFDRAVGDAIGAGAADRTLSDVAVAASRRMSSAACTPSNQAEDQPKRCVSGRRRPRARRR